MATASDIDDLLQCPICLEVFVDPKLLHCQHTFCVQCLKVYSARNSAGAVNFIECPICRNRTNLNGKTIEQLSTNFIVADIIERKFGRRTEQNSDSRMKMIEERLKMLSKTSDEKDEKNENNPMDYVKPAAAALVGLLGGLLLAGGVKKLREKKR